MSQSLTLPKGYKVKMPIRFTDGHGRTHAPLAGGEVRVVNEDIAEARVENNRVLEIEAKEVGQTAVQFHVDMGDDDGAPRLAASMMVVVTPERQEGEMPTDGPDRIEFGHELAHFEGEPKAEDPDRRKSRDRRRQLQEQARREARATDENAAEQDAARRGRFETPEEAALRSRGPTTHQGLSGVDLANRMEAERAGQSGRPGLASQVRPQDNPDDPDQPHNPGNQGGGDTTGRMASRGVGNEDARTADRARAEDRSGDGENDGDEGGEKPKSQSQSAQQRGGAAALGSMTSAPGAKKG